MQWSELKEKAKEMGYNFYTFLKDDGTLLTWLEDENVAFYDDGQIEIIAGGIISKNRTPKQMLAIMEALR